MLRSIVIAISLATGSVLIASESKITENSFEQELNSLDWQTSGICKLPSSKSSLFLPAEHLALIGRDAGKLAELFGNVSDSSLEAVTIDESLENFVYFFNHDEGYIFLDDWKDLDPKQLLAAIIKNTEENNKEGREKGFGEIHIVGWIQEPTLDRGTNTIYWSIEQKVDGNDENSFNSVALKLGRDGYERMVWVGNISGYKAVDGELDIMLRAHSFDSGHGYLDYTTGDKIAGYGIATLVAATVGTKIAKFSGLLLLFKKAGGFIIAGIAAIFFRLKRFFKRKTCQKNE